MPSPQTTVPKYVQIFESGELAKRVDKALLGLQKCQVCPWDCNINRLEDQKKICKTGRNALISSYFPHHGEENCLRGSRGSGTIFFAGCNLRCVFCQNFDISQEETGQEVSAFRLAEIMLELQWQGCHNINWVTPEHVVPQILEALLIAIPEGLRIPIVYNTSAFDSIDSIKQMDGIVDIYMPDFKYWSAEKSKRYLKTDKYPVVAQAVIKEMHRQVGDLIRDNNGIAQKGLLVRHLVMPGELNDSLQILNFISKEISRDTYINIMGQYRPAGKVSTERYQEINRSPTKEEMKRAFRFARAAGLHRFDEP